MAGMIPASVLYELRHFLNAGFDLRIPFGRGFQIQNTIGSKLPLKKDFILIEISERKHAANWFIHDIEWNRDYPIIGLIEIEKDMVRSIFSIHISDHEIFTVFEPGITEIDNILFDLRSD